MQKKNLKLLCLPSPRPLGQVSSHELSSSLGEYVCPVHVVASIRQPATVESVRDPREEAHAIRSEDTCGGAESRGKRRR